MSKIKEVIKEENFFDILGKTRNPKGDKILDILNKASRKKGLTLEDVGYLVNTDNPNLIKKMFSTAGKIKREIYGERLVFFAPLYVSSFCVNDCEYCGFHVRNKAPRKKLTIKEVGEQVRILEDMGHKRLLLEFGEHSKKNPIGYVVDVIKTIYKTKSGRGSIRRVNVNIAATTTENYQKLKTAGIGTYQLFQETYHRETYEAMHHGLKADYERQLFAHDRAFAGGIDDVGLGVLFGLYDWQFEVLGLVSHAQYLDKKFGVGPHTFSVPRFQPADTANLELSYRVSEDELLKIIAILRMAVPYTGMIISTRERPEIRAKAFEIGISQTSAASRTSPGGYGMEDTNLEQFHTADHRSVEKVLESIMDQDLLPSFCTACYRSGRTGKKFIELAKPGNIRNFCRPNAILTFKEYLLDYASDSVRKEGERIIQKYLNQIPDKQRKDKTVKRIVRLENGERDLYF
ncbi:MAG: thiH [Candidatus Berkelbacteria bacterium]|nr:thiH [Candidatus Berkelbacteria bacterium]